MIINGHVKKKIIFLFTIYVFHYCLYFMPNSRFIWVIDPGNTFFIVHNHNWQRFTDRFNVMEIQSIVKLAYTLRF